MAKKKKISGNEKKEKRSQAEKNLEMGREIIRKNELFGALAAYTGEEDDQWLGKEKVCFVTSRERVCINKDLILSPRQWANTLIHCRLHLAFGHFDADKMPGYEIERTDGKTEKVVECDKRIWNLACDAYITRFLDSVKFGESLYEYPFLRKISATADEREIYDYLVESGEGEEIGFLMDMEGLENPIIYDEEAGEKNACAEYFAEILAYTVSDTVGRAGGHETKRYSTSAERAAEWFLSHYPLLGGLAAAFQIVEDCKFCIQEEIQIAAIDVEAGEIYVNPAAKLSTEELKFVLAHEYLHAGLQHHERCQGRDVYLWNVACDFVINAWLVEMEIGEMPDRGLLYDEMLKGRSAEEIYDLILADIRKYSKMNTFRGYGKGDVMGGSGRKVHPSGAANLDEFCKSALAQGLEYHQSTGRGYIPAGLVEEIRALAMPPIPWDVELARWFEQYFPLREPRRTYARPSRRQGATPDIPRPRYVQADLSENARTFGVVIDTSGSVSAKMLGMALGSVASYAAAQEVPYARVVFCDASAYDAGYLAPEEIAGRVMVKGRGGTILQPGVDLLECAKDFPKDGPILIITDGMIENKMHIRHEHAFLIPRGKRLPFRAKGKVFYFE